MEKKRLSIRLDGNKEAQDALKNAIAGLKKASGGNYKVDPQLAFILGVSKLTDEDYKKLALANQPAKLQRTSMVEEFNKANGTNLSLNEITDLLLKKSLENAQDLVQ